MNEIVNVAGWIVIATNLGLAGFNIYNTRRLKRANRQAFDTNELLKTTIADFTRRFTAGEIRVVDSDGRAGTLVIEPEGDGLRIRVEPLEAADRVH